MNITPIRVLTTSDRKPPLLPNTEDLRTRALTEDLVLDLGPDCYNDWYDIVPKAGKKCRK
jgi:hypothetical protein